MARACHAVPHPRGAFTLVEMLVVTSVIALLLVISFPAFNAIRRSQRVKRTEAVVGALASGIQAYQNDFGIYPPAESQSGTNRGNRSLVVLLNVKGGASAPYLPSAFYHAGEIRSPLLLDEWDHPFIYFDTSVMRAATAHDYGVLGSVQPAKGPRDGDPYHNFGRFQLWSCGPNERNDSGKGTALGADDIANFVAQ